MNEWTPTMRERESSISIYSQEESLYFGSFELFFYETDGDGRSGEKKEIKIGERVREGN
jgi:hypothetical protein